MKISLLISTYNGTNDVTPLFDSILKLYRDNHELEVVVRDDNSSDGTADVVSKNYPWVKLIKGSETLGFVGSNNIAFEHATGDVICCVNQDTILDTRFLVEGLNALEIRPEVAGVNTNMIMPWVLSLEDFRNTPGESLPAYAYQLTPYGFTKYVPVEPALWKTNFLTGGGFFLRRSALGGEELLFDSHIRMYCEDTELSLRLVRQGFKLMYTPKAVLYHNQTIKKGRSFGEVDKLFKITWNRFHVLSRHLSTRDFLRNYPLYLWGIVRKMDYLGLPSQKRIVAYFAGLLLIAAFSVLLPYWLWHSFHFPETPRGEK